MLMNWCQFIRTTLAKWAYVHVHIRYTCLQQSVPVLNWLVRYADRYTYTTCTVNANTTCRTLLVSVQRFIEASFQKNLVAVKTAVCFCTVQHKWWKIFLTTESVEGASLSLEGVDNVHGCNGLSLGVLSVGDSITNDVLKENFQHTTGLFIDESRDTFDSTSTCKTTDGRLGDTLDVISKNFPVTLGAPLSKTFSSFASSWHLCRSVVQ